MVKLSLNLSSITTIMEQTFKSNNGEYLVFVYGTLKKNQPNYPVMLNKRYGEAKFLCSGRTVDKWPLVIASQFNIPYLLYKVDTGHEIHGEIYKVDEKMLKFLDEFEGHPTYYTRRQTPVLTKEYGILEPWTYFINQYKNEMLQLKMYDNYDSYGDHGLRYVERCDRLGPNATCGHTEKSEVILN